jgi:DNA-binding transcriptional regulator/RsmH inhibitor MraZ
MVVFRLRIDGQNRLYLNENLRTLLSPDVGAIGAGNVVVLWSDGMEPDQIKAHVKVLLDEIALTKMNNSPKPMVPVNAAKE